jgi:hypothetical protein
MLVSSTPDGEQATTTSTADDREGPVAPGPLRHQGREGSEEPIHPPHYGSRRLNESPPRFYLPLDGIQPKGLAPNEVEDHEYNNHQHDDANDPDTSKSSDHRSSFSDAGLPGRGGAQSLHLQREEHACLTPGQPGRLSCKNKASHEREGGPVRRP